jgi:C1A family cysteine protease
MNAPGGDMNAMNFLIGLTLFFPSFAVAKINIETLNKNLGKSQAGWVAKDNWINQLSPQEKIRMLGVREAPDAEMTFSLPESALLKTLSLPPQHDWRDYQGKNWVSPILNQANCGSCVAFAATGVLETQINISSLIPNLNFRFSPQHLFSCGGGFCDWGWMPNTAANHLKNKGVPDEACMPYTSGATGTDSSCKKTCADSSTRSFRISSFSQPSRGSANIEAVKAALLSGPLMTTLTVYEDFMVYAEGVYKRTSNKQLGGHAVSIVGYDDGLRAWIIRNSWGEGWGEKGFGHISYDDDSGIGRQTWLFQVPVMNFYVSTQFPRNYSYISGNTQFVGDASLSTTDSLQFNITGSKSLSASCKGAPCGYNLDSTSLADGRYEVETVALDSTGKTLGTSAKEFFYVLNSEPKMSLFFKGAGTLDLSKPQKGRIEFVLSLTSTPVPMSSIEFHSIGPDGVEKIRSSEVVIDQMKIGWRTNTALNGIHKVWMVGKIKTTTSEFEVKTPVVEVKVLN